MASGGEAKAAGYYQYPGSYGGGGGGGRGYGAGDDERRWWPWLVPTVLVACIAVFAAEMFVNDCPRHGSTLGGGARCVAEGFLRRFAFQPLRENPLLGPSSATYVPSLLAIGLAFGSPPLNSLDSVRNWGFRRGLLPGLVCDFEPKVTFWHDFKPKR
jgi:hypothetical protein